MSAVRLGSGAPWESVVGYSRAVVHGDTVWVSGTTATVDGVVVHPGDPGAQTRVALQTVARTLAHAGFALGDVVRTRIYVTDIAQWREAGAAHEEVLGDIRPAATIVEVSALIDPALRVEIEADAYVPED
jgi:enamine deaminase RidA (YjgF/YER057c/UK114 family)